MPQNTTTTATTAGPKRAIGVARVSRVGDRDAERLASPEEQADRIRAVCEREGWELVEVLPEINISGGDPLERRTGLRRAVEAVEAGTADVVVVAYFDRMFRDLGVQRSVTSRVAAAGGRLETADLGEISSATATDRLHSNLQGAITEYQKDYLGERIKGAQKIAVEQGRVPVALIPGLRRRDDGTAEIDEEKAAVVRAAFLLRRDGAPYLKVRDYLRDNGIPLSYHGTCNLLKSRQAIGEYTFGEHEGTLPAIIEEELFDAVQGRIGEARGRTAKSDRLLARLGVLRCGGCGSRMVVGSQVQQGQRYYLYRCSYLHPCEARATISAKIVEDVVVDEMKRLLAGVRERATWEPRAVASRARLDDAQARLDRAMRAFAAAGVEDELQATDELRGLREARDRARDEHERLAAEDDAATLAMSVSVEDWDRLSLSEQRGLVRAVFERVTVRRGGRGAGRVTVEPRLAQ